MAVVWRFRKDSKVVVWCDMEEEARRMSWEDVWRAVLGVGSGRGGIVGIEGCRGGDTRWYEGNIALVADGWIIRRGARDGCQSSWLIRVQALRYLAMTMTIRASASRGAGERRIAKGKYERVTYSRNRLG